MSMDVDGGHAEPVIGHAFARPVGFAHPKSAAVIASEAKQSRIFLRDGLDCFVAFAPRNDGKNFIDSEA
jgi:hypothetical protein